MNLKNRWIWIGSLALVALLLLTLFAAPRSALLQQGSTYSRAPSGYGAWYAYMEQQKLPIQRWQRPLNQLLKPSEATPSIKEITWTPASLTQTQPNAPITLIRINSGSSWSSVLDEDWIKQGNVLVSVGVRTPVTQAPFRSLLESPVGTVKIETTRRLDLNKVAAKDRQFLQARLSDSHGAVVWERQMGKGKIIYANASDLAANAYQDESGNFKFLAQIVSEPNHPIYVDEYLHGYKDKETITQETAGSLIGYLAKTPLLLLAIQAVVLVLVLIWGQNHRFGPAKLITEPAVDNSQAYIQALSSVLQKANCRDFVIETIGKAEQMQLQRLLGLGSAPLDPQVVIQAWVQQTGRPATEIQDCFNSMSTPPISDAELLAWLNKLQMIHRQVDRQLE